MSFTVLRSKDVLTLDLLQTTSASTSENMPTKRQWEFNIQ